MGGFLGAGSGRSDDDALLLLLALLLLPAPPTSMLLLLCPPRHVCTGRMPRPFSVCGGGLALCDLVYAYTLLTTPSYLAANERTFLHWMSTSVTIGSIAAALSGKFRAAVCAPFTDTAQIMGGLRLCLACRCSRACSQTLGG